MDKQSISKKPLYNLNLVIHETGVKADTLRAWERRYQLPQPQRSEGGHRLFSEFDIETIKWLVARQQEGMSISRAVQLWREMESDGLDPLSSLASQSTQPLPPIAIKGSGSLHEERNRWIQACLDFDEPAAEQVLNKSFAQFSVETVCIEILQSGLAEIGARWYGGKITVQQEHFASELALRRLYSLIQAAPQPTRQKTVLVACPQGENHTFSALLITLLLRYRSWNVVYLGANVPGEKIQETVQKTKPDLVVMSSMRLVTAATLLGTALDLKELGTPLAFGGRVFNMNPGLHQKIPGNYLGENLLEAIPIIESLLIGPAPTVDVKFEHSRLADTLSHFNDRKNQIETQVVNSLQAQLDPAIPFDTIHEANDHLAQDIIAALSLGDLSLLEPNIDWVENLIAYSDFPVQLLSDYLLAYHHAAQTHLDERGQLIIDLLASVVIKE